MDWLWQDFAFSQKTWTTSGCWRSRRRSTGWAARSRLPDNSSKKTPKVLTKMMSRHQVGHFLEFGLSSDSFSQFFIFRLFEMNPRYRPVEDNPVMNDIWAPIVRAEICQTQTRDGWYVLKTARGGVAQLIFRIKNTPSSKG